MPVTILLHQRFPVHCAVTYHAGTFQGQGTVWNFSLSGWKLSGDVPLRVGQTCSLFLTLSNPKRVAVVAGIVRWVRGSENGIETLLANGTTQARMVHYFRQQAHESMHSSV